MKATSAKNNCIIRIKFMNEIQCIKVYMNYNKQCSYKHYHF